MRNFALIGHPVSHSFSKQYFEKYFSERGLSDCTYSLIDVTNMEELRDSVLRANLDGFNVTSPHKTSIVPLLDDIDATAQDIGAVNCVVCRNGKWIGYNTDEAAFADTILSNGWDNVDMAIVMGSGGASKAAQHALHRLGVNTMCASRTPSNGESVSYADAAKIIASAEKKLLVNATPIGMASTRNDIPWPFMEMVDPSWRVYDMIYNPSPTRLMQTASQRGATCCDGLQMLYRQADMSRKHFGLP